MLQKGLQLTSRPSVTDEEETYAFTIDVVRGADSRQVEDEVRVIALYNTASQHDFISWRFAEETLRIGEHHEYNTKGDGRAEIVTLHWSCLGLGRYREKSVFIVAPHADFNVLFGGKKEVHQLPDQRGISQGLEESFRQGIKNGAMVHVEQISAAKASNSSPAQSSLADLQALIDNTELQPLHRAKHNDNIGNVSLHARPNSSMPDKDPDEHSRRAKSTRQNQDIRANPSNPVPCETMVTASNSTTMPNLDQTSTSLLEAQGPYQVPYGEVVVRHQPSRHENEAVYDSLMTSRRVTEKVAYEEGVTGTKRRQKHKSRGPRERESISLEKDKGFREVPPEEESVFTFPMPSQRVAEEATYEEGATGTKRRQKDKSRGLREKESTNLQEGASHHDTLSERESAHAFSLPPQRRQKHKPRRPRVKESSSLQEGKSHHGVPSEKVVSDFELSRHDEEMYTSFIPPQNVTERADFEETGEVEVKGLQEQQSQGPEISRRKRGEVLGAEDESFQYHGVQDNRSV